MTVVLFPPLVFLFCAYAASPSAASPSGFCPLTEWIGMSVSSLLVYSSGWLGGVWLRPLPQGLQRTLFSLGVVCWAYPAPLACGVMWTLHPVSGCSRCGVVCWVTGGVPLLPFLSLRVGVLLAEVSPEFVGCEGGLRCPSWFVILFLCLC